MSTSLLLVTTVSGNASINAGANTAHENQSHTSYFSNISLCIPSKDFLSLLKKQVNHINPKTSLKCSHKLVKTCCNKNNDRLCKSICSLIAALFHIYKSQLDEFIKLGGKKKINNSRKIEKMRIK